VLPPGVCQDRKPTCGGTDLREEIRNEFLRNSEELLLLAIGVDAQRKGLDRTIHAVAALPSEVRCKTRVVAVGESRTRQFERLAKRLSISDRVTLLPPRTDIPRFLYGADLLVHPAHSEAGGTVILEAMAHGLPVFVTDVCGYASCVMAAQSGYIMPSPFQQEHMNRSLLRLLTSHQLQALSANAQDFTRSTTLYHRSEHIATIIESQFDRRRHRVSST
jgi:UDP-glucose:(heptosyl)LPS alpha-1,3-glucosyltransferase